MRLPVAIHSLGRKLAWTDETVIVCIVWLKAPRESGCMLQKQAAAKNDRDRTVQALPCLGLHLRICEATLDFEMWLEGFICSRLHVPVVHSVLQARVSWSSCVRHDPKGHDNPVPLASDAAVFGTIGVTRFQAIRSHG